MSDFPGRVARYERLLTVLASVEAQVECMRAHPKHDPGLQARFGAIMQLDAVIEFLGPDAPTEHLTQLRIAVQEINDGRRVQWLDAKQAYRPEGRRISTEVRLLRGRYAQILELLVTRGMGEKAAAQLVAKHGNLKRLVEKRGEKYAAKSPSESVRDWRATARRDPSSVERRGYETAVIVTDGASDREIQNWAKEMLKVLNSVPID